jgi:cystathionine beta-lyase
MAQICLSKEVLIVSDEIHCDLLYDGRRHIPIASLDEEISNRAITLLSPSKTFNIAGLQCAFAIIQNKSLRDAFCKAREGLVSWVTAFGQIAALAAYRDGQPWLDELLVYLDGNRRFASEYIREEMPGMRMIMPEGTYLAWLDCRELGIQGEPGRFFMRQGRVALNEGSTFGPGGEGFLRLNFGCPRSMLQEALERMKTALQQERMVG